mmetsp:Transcript_167768/g.538773  ORF Transcript_167768/g.538773 Transcript_167768/m.538773 type:complete len:212 (+) Transcript_167768:320-955(+)
MFNVLFVMPLVLRAIGELHDTIAMHVALGPLSCVHAPAYVSVAAVAVHLVVSELPFILYSRARFVHANSMLAAMQKLAFIPRAICPSLHPSSRLFVLVPLPLVSGAVDVNIFAMPMLLVKAPLPLESRALRLCEEALAMRAGVFEFAFILVTLRKHQDAPAVSLFGAPLAPVPGASLHLDLRALHQIAELRDAVGQTSDLRRQRIVADVHP